MMPWKHVTFNCKQEAPRKGSFAQPHRRTRLCYVNWLFKSPKGPKREKELGYF